MTSLLPSNFTLSSSHLTTIFFLSPPHPSCHQLRPSIFFFPSPSLVLHLISRKILIGKRCVCLIVRLTKESEKGTEN